TISISTGEYAPFTGENLPSGGVVNGLVSRVLAEAGLQAEFQYFPWKRALQMARSGDVAASSYWGEREDQTGLAMVGPIVLDRNVLFFRRDKPVSEFDNVADLGGIVIGVTAGYSYTPAFWAAVESGSISVEETDSDETNFRKLLAGRIDAFIADEYVGYYLLDQAFSAEERQQLTSTESAVMGNGGFIQVSLEAEGGAELAERLQATIDAMQASGSLDAARAELRAEMGLGG
ncbi:MAG: transporter substrate-binding domain-containing protein, partial [Pseudomonadota bacterium]